MGTNPYFILATFRTCFFSPFSSLSQRIFRITTRENGNVQPDDQAESKLNSAINANSDAHTLTHD